MTSETIVTYRVLDRSNAIRTQGVPEDAARRWIAHHMGDVMLRAGAPFTLERVTVTMSRHAVVVETFDVEPEA